MIQEFENWVLENYPGQLMDSPPDDWDQETEFFYKIKGRQYRIKLKDVPKRFRLVVLA